MFLQQHNYMTMQRKHAHKRTPVHMHSLLNRNRKWHIAHNTLHTRQRTNLHPINIAGDTTTRKLTFKPDSTCCLKRHLNINQGSFSGISVIVCHMTTIPQHALFPIQLNKHGLFFLRQVCHFARSRECVLCVHTIHDLTGCRMSRARCW